MNFAEELLAKGRDEATAVVFRGTSLSYNELRATVARWAGGLRAAGLSPGERVALLAENSPFALTAYLAVIYAGGVIVPMSPGTLPEHIEHQLVSTGCRMGFLQWKYRKRWESPTAAAQLTRVWLSEVKSGELPLGWANSAELAVAAERAASRDSADLAALMFTSGSTGVPRGVMVSHGNLRANTRSIVEYLQLGASDRAFLVLPLYYCFGASVVHTHLAVGGSLVLANLQFPEKVLDEIKLSGSTGFYGVPSTYQILLRRTSFAEQQFPTLRYFAQAGGRLPHPFIAEIRGHFPCVPFFVMYGQTEATARLSYLPPERMNDKTGSIGRGLPGTVLRVLDERGQPVPPGEVGEIVASGENITAGYWDDPEETARHFRDGLLWTGDLGVCDEEGFIYVRDRARDFIKVAGVRVSSKEIEDVIAELPAVVEVAVIGTPDDLLGEAIEAFVVARDEHGLMAHEVLAHCQRRLSNEKEPKQVHLLPQLPKNEFGKVLKARLREEAAARRARGEA